MNARNVPKETILQARKLREEKGYSYQYIVDKAEELGVYTSMSTVRRFFTDNVNEHNFGYQAVQGILDVVFDIDSETKGNVAPETADALKHAITELHKQLDEQRAAYKAALELQKEQYSAQILQILTENEKKIDFIKDEVAALRKQIEIKDRRLDERDALLRGFVEKLL